MKNLTKYLLEKTENTLKIEFERDRVVFYLWGREFPIICEKGYVTYNSEYDYEYGHNTGSWEGDSNFFQEVADIMAYITLHIDNSEFEQYSEERG